MLRRPHPNRLARNESMRAVADSSTARPYAKQMQEGPSGVLVVAGMLKAATVAARSGGTEVAGYSDASVHCS